MLQPRTVIGIIVLLFSAFFWVATSSEEEIVAIVEADSHPGMRFTFQEFRRGTVSGRNGIVGYIQRIGTEFYQDIAITITGRDRKGREVFREENPISPLWLSQYPYSIRVEFDANPRTVKSLSYRLSAEKSTVATNERVVEYMVNFFRTAQITCKLGNRLGEKGQEGEFADNLQNLYYGDMGHTLIGLISRTLADACIVWDELTPTHTNREQPGVLTPFMGYVFYPDMSIDRKRGFGIFGIPAAEQYGDHCYWIDEADVYKRPMDFAQDYAIHPRIASPLDEPEAWELVGIRISL